MSEKIEFMPNTPMYKQYYLKECSGLEKVLRTNCINVYHVGSTAIAKISARPTLDILCVVHTLDGITLFENEFNKLGLKLVKHLADDKMLVFERKSADDSMTLSRIYIHDKSDPRINDSLDFRDHLNKDDSAAKEYEKRKLELASDPKTYDQKKAALRELIVSTL